MLCCTVATACATYRGVTEFEAYRSAFEKTYSTSVSILDQLAIHERAQFLRLSPAKPSQFEPSLAAYYTDAVDPPSTAAFRRSLDTVKAYNDLLYGLASGQTADVLVAKAGELRTHALAAGHEVSLLAQLSPQGLGIGAGLDSAFRTLRPFAELGLTLRSRQQFRRYLVQYHPVVENILIQLRSGTSEIFPVLTDPTLRRARDSRDGSLTAGERAKVEAYRTLLSDWVILLDGSLAALRQAKAAVEAPATISGSITGLTVTSSELQAAALSARRHIAELSAVP